MRQNHRRAAILLCSVALAAIERSALARPLHHRQASDQQQAMQAEADSGMHDPRYPWLDGQPVTAAPMRTAKFVMPADTPWPRAMRGWLRSRMPIRPMAAPPATIWLPRRANISAPIRPGAAACGAAPSWTWCSRTGPSGGGNLALGYAHYGTRVSGPQVGAIAVMGRHGGGHVGVVSGIDANGNPIIVSGNHNHTVAESVYPRGRITAYVMPGG